MKAPSKTLIASLFAVVLFSALLIPAVSLRFESSATSIGEAAPQPPPSAPTPEPARDDTGNSLTEAELFAVTYPQRAKLIRSLGHLPEPCSFGPPAPELVRAIVSGTSPVLLELDRQAGLAAV